VRLSPQSQHTPEIIQAFHDVLTQQTLVTDALQKLSPLMPDQPCNGYWYGKPGLAQLTPQPA
jgi:hypothetical protein